MLVAALCLGGASTLGASAQATNSQSLSDKIVVQASPSPTPAPPPAEHPHRIHISGSTDLTIMDQNYVGSGLFQPEGNLPTPLTSVFGLGLPIAPGMPYDFFSSSPTASGFGLGQNVRVTLSYGPGAVDYGVNLGFGSVSGSAQTIGYWGEQPIPTINPHLGQTSYQLPLAFPTKPGLDDVSGVRGSVLGGYIATKDGNYALNGGWIDLKQTIPFVFKQAPALNSAPALAVVPPNSIGNGSPTLEDWLPSITQYPVEGLDAYAKVSNFTFEGTTASLPAPMGVGARLLSTSVMWDRGNGLHFGAQWADIHTGGIPIMTTIMYGAPITFGAATAGPCAITSSLATTLTATTTYSNNTIMPGVPSDTFGQGNLPFSCLAGQQNQVIGFTGSGNLFTFVDGTADWGVSQYSTASVANVNGTGQYFHGGLTEHLGGTLSLTQDYYYVDPHWAPTILPYGNTPVENIWSAAYSWPGQWLRGTYQSVDNTQAYNNRHGYKFGVDYEGDIFQARVKYSVLSEVTPITLSTGIGSGFVEGYYLPELVTTGGNLGIDRQLAVWVALHPKPFDVTLDYVTENNYRPAWTSPLDVVAMNYPQSSITLSHTFFDKLLVAGGISNYLLKGTWAGNLVNMNQNVIFLGAQFLKSQSQQFLVQARYYNTNGTPPLTDTIAPTLRGLQLLFEQKAKI